MFYFRILKMNEATVRWMKEMLSGDFILAIRNLLRHKLIAFINILGLSIGISSCLLLFLIINVDLGFERFNPDRESTYRVYSKISGSREALSRGVPTAFSAVVREQFTGVEAVANFHNYIARATVINDEGGHTVFPANKIIITHPGYFNVFNYYEWL